MLVRFARIFEILGHQVLVQRQKMPAYCATPGCSCIVMRSEVTIVVLLPQEDKHLLMSIPGAAATTEAAQQLLDHFEQADAREALEILQANYYQVATAEESSARVNALRQRILNRITESV